MMEYVVIPYLSGWFMATLLKDHYINYILIVLQLFTTSQKFGLITYQNLL